MTSHHHRRRAACLVVALGLAVTAAPAAATDGPIYWRGASIWGVQSPFTAGWVQNALQVRQAAQATATAGNVWEMNWGCDVPGTEVAQVRFGALRTTAPSSLEVRVTGNRNRIWGIPDAQVPQSPAAGQVYGIDLPPGQCNVHLALTQTETRSQHARTYFIDGPSVALRDLTAPSVSITGLTGGWFGAAPRALTVGWSAGDNFGSDGMGAHDITVGGLRVWTGAPGAGGHAINTEVPAGLPDGIHTVTVTVRGDGTGAGSASGSVRVDRTAPAVATNRPAHRGVAREATLSWSTADAVSGMSSSRAELAVGGGWIVLASAGGGAQARTVTVPTGIPDGVHAWRVAATDAAGNTRTVGGEGSVIVDTTPPTLTVHAAPSGWTRTADVDITAGDNLAGALGLGATEVDVNTASDGSTSGTWRRVASQVRPAGRAAVAVPLDGIADGSHRVRITVRNGGPFGAHLASTQATTVRVDRTAPTVGAATFTQPESGLLRATWAADDATSGVARATVQWLDGERWRTLTERSADQGVGTMVADISGVATGTHRFRVVVSDAAGNTATGEGRLAVTRVATGRDGVAGTAAGRGGAGSDADDPFARLRSARLSIAMPGARITRRADGRTVLVRTLRIGSRTPLVARLRDASGAPMGGAEVEARGHRGAVVARGRTNAAGHVRLMVRPEAGARLRVGVPAGGALLPARAQADARVRVRPRVVLRRAAGTVRTGERVMFTGRIYPAPARLGLRSRKGVVLEWRDPIRGTWRPVVNAPVRRDGTFTIPWRFNLRGLAVPMRARVPAEIGWPLMPALSAPIRVVPR